MYETLKKEIEYAKASYPYSTRELLYQTYGRILMAFELGAITEDEYLSLSTECVKDGINNPQYFDRD